MKCKKCGAEIGTAKFCTECGTKIDEIVAESETVSATEIKSASEPENDNAELKKAMENLKSFEEGTITDPSEKPVVKRKPFCWKNPVLGNFLGLLIVTAILALVTVIFFNVEGNGVVIFYRIAFTVITAAVFALAILVYLPNAFRLDKMLKGKNVKFEYKIRKEELEPLAKKARKRNRVWYLIVAIAGLGFTSYYAYICATAAESNFLFWLSFWFSFAVFAVATALFFIMPILNHNRMLENGQRVIIGEKSVYYGGFYRRFFGTEPKLTYGKYNSKTNEFTLTFTKVSKNGNESKKKIEMYAPIKESNNIMKLLDLYEIDIREYRLKQQRNSILTGTESEQKTASKELNRK